ncbi:MAG TPA: HNH endonuclease [Lelliottia sp.]|jgi:putative restriction endonuclease
MTIAKSLSQKIAEMKTAWYDNAPALNKPLLILYVLSRYKQGHGQLFNFQTEIHLSLQSLLKRYGPKRKVYETIMPFWRLRSDGFWSLECSNPHLLASKKEPSLAEAIENDVSGGFDTLSFYQLKNHNSLIDILARQIIDKYLPLPLQNALSNELGFEKPLLLPYENDLTDHFDLIKHDINMIAEDISLNETTKTALIQARIGQGTFRNSCLKIYPACPVTGISFEPLLKASHIKRWSDCLTAQERLDPYNGIMLTAHIDALFDSGWISFANGGEILISNQLDFGTCDRLGLPEKITQLPHQTIFYMEWHRKHIFKA